MKAGRGFLALFAVLTAGAIGAPLAHAGSYDVLSCTIDGSYHANNAWGATNNPPDNGAYATDTTCPKSGDPIGVSLAANTAYGNGTHLCRGCRPSRRCRDRRRHRCRQSVCGRREGLPLYGQRCEHPLRLHQAEAVP